MITVEKDISLPETYPLSRLGQLEKLLFFDIETTGFSGDHSRLYLIGCTFCRGGWKLIQWFADDAGSEKELLTAFFGLLKQFSAIVHFNGDGFDIPFLLKRCLAWGLDFDFSGVESIDIYRRIRPYRRIMGLESLKQKNIEQFLGIHREDPFSGGQLIEVYSRYLVTRENRLYDMLMLHNREDLEGMPLILPILSYPDFLENDFAPESVRLLDAVDGPVLRLCVRSGFEIPVPIRWSFSCGIHPCSAQANGSRLTFELGLYRGSLKHYYADYQNYYYLPFEDRAVHKSVGEYVEKSARKKASAQTCYVKKDGLFLPQPEPIWENDFKREWKDRYSYALYDESLFADPTTFMRYIRSLLSLPVL